MKLKRAVEVQIVKKKPRYHKGGANVTGDIRQTGYVSVKPIQIIE